MTGSLQHLGGDRWRIRVYAGQDPVTGAQRVRSKTFRANGERAAKKAQVQHLADLQKAVDHERAQVGTVADAATRWIAKQRLTDLSPRTLESYELIVARIVATFGRRKLADLRGRDIEAWYLALQQPSRVDGEVKPGLSRSTVRKHHAVMRLILSQAARWEMVDRIATDQVKPPELREHEIRPPTTAALWAVLGAVGGDTGNALRFLAVTGMRRGELCGLRWSDIDDGRMTIRRAVVNTKKGLVVKDTKTHRPRTMPLPPSALEVLADQRAWLEAAAVKLRTSLPADGPVFADMRRDPGGRTPRSPHWLTQRWMKIRVEHGLVACRLHDFRHAYATGLIAEGVPLTTVSRMVGHSKTSTTTDVYGHGTDAGERLAIAAVSKATG